MTKSINKNQCIISDDVTLQKLYTQLLFPLTCTLDAELSNQLWDEFRTPLTDQLWNQLHTAMRRQWNNNTRN